MKDLESSELYSKIDLARRDCELTIYKLAKKACISQSAIYNWRDSKSMPTLPILNNLCGILKMPIRELFLDDEQKELLNVWDRLAEKERQYLLMYLKESAKNKATK